MALRTEGSLMLLATGSFQDESNSGESIGQLLLACASLKKFCASALRVSASELGEDSP